MVPWRFLADGAGRERVMGQRDLTTSREFVKDEQMSHEEREVQLRAGERARYRRQRCLKGREGKIREVARKG